MPLTNLYIKEVVLSTIVATIISYYYFLNKLDIPKISPTIHNINCELHNYCI